MQIDVGFGDVVVPAPVDTTYPVILDLPTPRLYGYSRETAIAEKLGRRFDGWPQIQVSPRPIDAAN